MSLSSLYYQAIVVRSTTWFVSATLKSFDNLVFVRTLDAQKGLLEFFVAPAMNDEFCALMTFYQQQGFVQTFEQKANRLLPVQSHD